MKVDLSIEEVDIDSVLSNEQLFNKLNKLTIRRDEGSDSSVIRNYLSLLKKSPEEIANYKPFVFLARRQDTKDIVGWSFCVKQHIQMEYKKIPHYWIMLYVDQDMRQMGIGRTLIEYVLNFFDKKKELVFVTPWDYKSVKFYMKYFKRTMFENEGYILWKIL